MAKNEVVTSWRTYNKKDDKGEPDKRWRDDLDKYWSDTIWQRTAQDRLIWRQLLRSSSNHGTIQLPNDDDDYWQMFFCTLSQEHDLI